MPINEECAELLGQQSLCFLERERPDLVKWATKIGPSTFKYLKLRQFLYNYCWVVYCAGFKFEIIELKFTDIKACFHDFDPEKLSRMRSVSPVLKVFNNENKATSFLEGAKQIIKEGIVPLRKECKVIRPRRWTL
jgi:hypothetical protein